MEVWEEWCTVTVTVMISMTAPIKVAEEGGNKVSSKDTMRIQSSTPCAVLLGFFTLCYLSLSREDTGEQRKGGVEG